tara:strand:+ start:70 stop:441 length:372 start_codon:yes stop_codon:yes gene_type:complete
MKTMTVKSKFSPLRGEEVEEKEYKSYFRGNNKTPHDLLRCHLHAAVAAKPERTEEFLEFYRWELEVLVDKAVSLETQNAAYIMGRRACFLGEQEFPSDLPEEWKAEWTRGHGDFQAWEAGMNL